MILTRPSTPAPEARAAKPRAHARAAHVKLRAVQAQRPPHSLAPVPFEVSCRCIGMEAPETAAQGMREARQQRQAIISALYQQRRSQPSQPGITLSDIEQMLKITKVELEFTLWYPDRKACS